LRGELGEEAAICAVTSENGRASVQIAASSRVTTINQCHPEPKRGIPAF